MHGASLDTGSFQAEAGSGQLTDILVKTDSNRDRTDRYMRMRWPPKRFWMYSGKVTIWGGRGYEG